LPSVASETVVAISHLHRRAILGIRIRKHIDDFAQHDSAWVVVNEGRLVPPRNNSIDGGLVEKRNSVQHLDVRWMPILREGHLENDDADDGCRDDVRGDSGILGRNFDARR